MKIKYLFLIFFVILLNISCDEFECDNFEVLDGNVTMNGEKMYPIQGTILATISALGINSASWSVFAVEENCEFANQFLVSIGNLASADPVGEFDFANSADVGGQVTLDFDSDNMNGTTLQINEGSLEVVDLGGGVFSLDVDAVLSNGDPFTLTTEFKFQ